jgi:hypothetical protein
VSVSIIIINFTNFLCILLIMRWILKLSFDQNSIMINYKHNGNFKNHLIIRGTQERLVKLLCFMKLLN